MRRRRAAAAERAAELKDAKDAGFCTNAQMYEPYLLGVLQKDSELQLAFYPDAECQDFFDVDDAPAWAQGPKSVLWCELCAEDYFRRQAARAAEAVLFVFGCAVLFVAWLCVTVANNEARIREEEEKARSEARLST